MPRTTKRFACSPQSSAAGAHIASHAIVLAGQNVAPGESVGTFPADRG